MVNDRIEKTSPQPEANMQEDEVIKAYSMLEENGIDVYIDGGWGIDALLEKQTRPHADLDIAVQHKDVPKLRELFKALGYKDVDRDDTTDYNFVLGDDKGHEVDVHSYTLDSNGKNIYGIAYPADSLTGTGRINGRFVKCISLESVLSFHANYEPGEKEFKDIQALRDKFGVELPDNYKPPKQV